MTLKFATTLVRVPEDELPGADAQAALRIGSNGVFQVWTKAGWLDADASGVAPVSGAEYGITFVFDYAAGQIFGFGEGCQGRVEARADEGDERTPRLQARRVRGQAPQGRRTGTGTEARTERGSRRVVIGRRQTVRQCRAASETTFEPSEVANLPARRFSTVRKSPISRRGRFLSLRKCPLRERGGFRLFENGRAASGKTFEAFGNGHAASRKTFEASENPNFRDLTQKQQLNA